MEVRIAVLLVVAHDARLASKRALDGPRSTTHALDEAQIVSVGVPCTGEVARLLDHDLLSADLVRELLSRTTDRG